MSEEPLSELERLDLWHYSEDMSPEDRELRHEFIAQVYAPPRIVRQALDRYGPQPAESNLGEDILSVYPASRAQY